MRIVSWNYDSIKLIFIIQFAPQVSAGPMNLLFDAPSMNDEVSSVIASDTDLGIEGPLLIHKIAYECTSLLVCKVGNYINKEKESTVEKLIKVYVGRQPNAAITTVKDGKLQNSGTNISICPRDGMVFSCDVNTSPPPDMAFVSIIYPCCYIF
uniref:Uncharacterized protein n=1 Tax=Magallana gigas TaxID=29159 RepID=K1QN61_MAGGI